jgi:hypothetical protein
MSLYLPEDPTEVPESQRLPGAIYRSICAREVRLDREARGADATGYLKLEQGAADALEDVGF